MTGAGMKSTTSRTHTDPDRAGAMRKKGDLPGAITGGAPATEEDIGTEGAGTEPRDSAQTNKRSSDSSSKARRRDKGAA